MPPAVVEALFERNPLPMWVYDLRSLAFLAVNRSAIAHYGYSREQFLAMTIADIRPPEDVEALLGNVRQVEDSLDRAGVWRHRKRDGSLIHVEITSHPIAFDGHEAELVIAYDVSARVAAETNLRRVLELESLIAEIAKRLSTADSLNAAIDDALGTMGAFVGAGRAYLFEFDLAAGRMSNSREWCAAGVEAHRDELQDIPMDRFAWSLGQIRQGHALAVPDVSTLPTEAANEREAFEQQSIRSLIMVPLPGGPQVAGFLGFDNVIAAESWSDTAQRLLQVAAELIGAARQRQRDRDALVASTRQLDSIMRSAEHFVFYRLAVDPAAPHQAQLEFASDSLSEIIGAAPNAPFDSWFERVHPDDLGALEAANAEASTTGKRFDVTIRMRHPARDEWRWIRAVSNPVIDANGRISHYNGFMLDVTDAVEANRALQTERDFANAVTETVGALVVVLDREGRIVRFNRACEIATGYSSEEVEGRCVWDFLLLPGDREPVKAVFRDLRDAPAASEYENHWVSKDGREILIAWSNTTILDERGRLLYAIGTGIDITERKQAELTIRTLSSAVDQSASGIVIVDRNGRLEYVNPAYAALCGRSPEALTGQPADFLGTAQSTDPQHQRIWQHMLAGDIWRGELQHRKPDGSPGWALVTVSPIRSPDAKATHYAALLEDVTELKHAHENLERLAAYDPLTGLPNRRLFRDRLERALTAVQRHSQLIAVLYLDLDNFKRVNDSQGHDVGDALLREVAQRLTACVRSEDTVARLGGDEFVLLIQNIAVESHVDTVAQKILRRMRDPIQAADHEVVVTASIGITLAPADSTDPGILLRNADLAMYRAKDKGRDGVAYFEGGMNLEVSRRLSLEGELRRALEQEQLEPHFQPIVRLSDLRIVGFEALARWRHPQEGMIAPAQFIPVAEECGLIIPLGEYLLERAARELRRLREAHGADLYVTVNLSAQQARGAGLVEVIAGILQRSDLPSGALHVEITESLLMADFNVARNLLGRLRDRLDTRVAIDDFGTGYSSLSYLKQLPVDTLKVDRSFVRDIPGDQNDVEITAAIIAMGQALSKEVVAEGVETTQQLAFLRERGCHLGQGYLFGAATDPGEFMRRPLTIDLPERVA